MNETMFGLLDGDPTIWVELMGWRWIWLYILGLIWTHGKNGFGIAISWFLELSLKFDKPFLKPLPSRVVARWKMVRCKCNRGEIDSVKSSRLL